MILDLTTMCSECHRYGVGLSHVEAAANDHGSLEVHLAVISAQVSMLDAEVNAHVHVEETSHDKRGNASPAVHAEG